MDDNIPPAAAAAAPPSQWDTAAELATIWEAYPLVSELATQAEDAYLAAFLASVFGHANLTDAKGASIFDHPNLTVPKLTSIYNHPNLAIQKGQEIMDAQATPEKSTIEAVQVGPNTATAGGANTLSDTGEFVGEDWTNFILVITANTGAGQYRIISSNTDDALTVSANWHTNPDNTSTYEIRAYRLGFIGDDWDDNPADLEVRSNAATVATSLDKIFQHFRPEWATVAGDPAAAGGVLVLSNDSVKTASSFNVGTWEYTVTKLNNAANLEGFDLWLGATSKYMLGWNAPGQFYLYDVVDAAIIITSAQGTDLNQHTHKLTRDSNSNWELFFDGVSTGTVVDDTTTTFDEIHITEVADQIMHIDNLKIY